MLRRGFEGDAKVHVVDAVGDGQSALKRLAEVKLDVVLMDIDLGPGPSGIETGIKIKAQRPSVGIVLLSMHIEKDYLQAIPEAQRAGWSYLLKQSVSDLASLTRAIEGAAAGFVVLDPALVTTLKPKPKSAISGLSPRLAEVLELMAQGFDNPAIAGKLHVGEKSVENYVNAIYQQLGVTRADSIHPRVKAVLHYLDQSRHVTQ